MDFLNILSEYIDIDKYYKKLYKYNEKDKENLYRYINIKWSKIINNLNKNMYSCKKLKKYTDFNENIKEFIDDDIMIGIFVKNIIDRY